VNEAIAVHRRTGASSATGKPENMGSSPQQKFCCDVKTPAFTFRRDVQKKKAAISRGLIPNVWNLNTGSGVVYLDGGVVVVP
jgi:hypothetical protein